ncbi:MAG: HD-GYP domain-containing protein [Desulfitobacteriaceae bacterium]
MKLKIIPIQVDAVLLGKPSPFDLFDQGGCLLLEKGQAVTAQVFELAYKREIYVVSYEWTELAGPKQSADFKDDQFQKAPLKHIRYNSYFIRIDYLKQALPILARSLQELERCHGFPGFSWLDNHDRYTYIHSVNVALLATIIGIHMGYGNEGLSNLASGAVLHDWGKLLVPREILHKPSALSPEEFQVIKSHPARGEQVLRDVGWPDKVLRVIREHHERWRGQGYPDSLRAGEIHPNAQIVAVADVFDALTEDRPYKVRMSPYHALEMILNGSGSSYAPEVVRAFRSCVLLYPEHSTVTLSSGETGVVIALAAELPTRPVVRIIADRQGRPVRGEKIIDLRKNHTLTIDAVTFDRAMRSQPSLDDRNLTYRPDEKVL